MAKKTPKAQFDIEQAAIALVTREKQMWENATVFVTERVSFNLRNLIRTLRKNYWGIWDNPTDKNTGKKKIWIPLTESVCDAHTTSVDIDTKDINLRAKHPKAIGFVALARTILKNWLDNHFFGEKLDEMERALSIDGSHVWKTIKIKHPNGRSDMKLVDVDLLNLYFDFTGTESLQEKHRVTERALLSEEAIKAMDGWINTEGVQGKQNLHPTEPNLGGTSGNISDSSSKLLDVWETWGWIPLSLITGKTKDTEEVEGHIVVSGIETGDKRVHLIEKNTKTDSDGNAIRPYEEVHTKRIAGRWLGRGPAEAVMMLQLWINIVVNIRIVRSYVSQLGIFKIKRGRGITPQMVSRLPVSGAILVKDMEDIEQFIMQEASQSSYTDEETIKSWAEKITSTFPGITGEPLPSSKSATGQVLETRAAINSFKMLRDNIGFMIQRWLKRQAMPILTQNIKIGDVVRMTGSFQELRERDELLVNRMVAKEIESLAKQGLTPNAEEVIRAKDIALEKLKSMGEDRFTRMMSEIDFTQFDVQAFVTSEEKDVGILAANINKAMQVAPQYAPILIRELFDIMGLNVNELDRESRRLNLDQQTQVPGQGEPGQEEPVAPPAVSANTPQTAQGAFTGANV